MRISVPNRRKQQSDFYTFVWPESLRFLMLGALMIWVNLLLFADGMFSVGFWLSGGIVAARIRFGSTFCYQ
jgi:hypothetical protein